MEDQVVSNMVLAQLVEGRSLVVVLVVHIPQQEAVADPTQKQFPIVALEVPDQWIVIPGLEVGLTADAACCPIWKLLVRWALAVERCLSLRSVL